MAIPESKLTITDGALGIVDSNGINTVALVGACSSGTASTAYTFTDIPTLVSTLGTGPMVELAAYILSIAGGSVICYKPANQVSGSMGSITPTKTGTATLAISGNPNDAYQLEADIVQGGATLVAGTATFKYSLDGGLTFSAELAVPTGGSYVVPNTGLTLTWSYTSGTAFVAGDKWTASATAPSHAITDIGNAVDALVQDSTLSFFAVGVVGETPDVTTTGAAWFSALATKMANAETVSFRYAFLQLCLGDDTDANIKAGNVAVSSADNRMSVASGFAKLASAISGATYKRSTGWLALARLAAIGPGTDAAQVSDGPVRGVTSLYRDEGKTPGLDAARLTTARTFVGMPGFYLTNARIKSSPGSDFEFAQHRRVMDIASAVLRQAQLFYLSKAFRVNRSTGLILEADAAAVEARIERQLRTALTEPNYVSDLSVAVDRTVNMLSAKKLVLRYRLIPLAYAKAVEGELGFYNPRLVPA